MHANILSLKEAKELVEPIFGAQNMPIGTKIATIKLLRNISKLYYTYGQVDAMDAAMNILEYHKTVIQKGR